MSAPTLAVVVDNGVKPEMGKVYVTVGGHTLKPMRYKKRSDSNGYNWHTELEGQTVRRSYNAEGRCKGGDRGYDLKYVYKEERVVLATRSYTFNKRTKKAIPMNNPQKFDNATMEMIDKELNIFHLEVGKMYRCRDGIIRHCVYYNALQDIFLDELGNHYKANGRVAGGRGDEHHNTMDMLSEYVEPKSGVSYINVFKSVDGKYTIGLPVDDVQEATYDAAEYVSMHCNTGSTLAARAKFMWIEGNFEE